MPYSLQTIHPLFIHFPIALLSTGLFFDLLAVILYRKDSENAGFWCMLMGIIACLFSNFTGLMAFLSEGVLSDLLKFTHSLFALCTTLTFVVLLWARMRLKIDYYYPSLKRYIFFAIYILAVGILFYGAHLGAMAAERI